MGFRDMDGVPTYRLKPRTHVALVDDFRLSREAFIEAAAIYDSSINFMPFATSTDCALSPFRNFHSIVYYYRECRDSNLHDIAMLHAAFPRLTVTVLCHIDVHKVRRLERDLVLRNLPCAVLRPRTMPDLLKCLTQRDAAPIATNQNVPP